MGFPGGSEDEESACSAGDLGSIPDWEDPVEEGMAIFLSGESHGQRSLVGYSPWGCKEPAMTEQLNHEHTQRITVSPTLQVKKTELREVK